MEQIAHIEEVSIYMRNLFAERIGLLSSHTPVLPPISIPLPLVIQCRSTVEMLTEAYQNQGKQT
jgi:hypothetical protein